jgi:DNA repair protein RadC
MMNNFLYGTEEEVIDAALHIMESKVANRELCTAAADVKRYFQLRLGNEEREVFCVMFLDNQHKLIHTEDMFRGTIDGASVYPREVVKAALRCNAAAVIFSHNHPSGVAEPSHADRTITDRLVEALKLVDIRVLDHIVVSASETVSFAERGLI